MPRSPVVSRTMQTTLVKAMCMNLETRQAEEKTIRIPRSYKKDSQLLTPVKKALEDEKTRVVYIIESHPQLVKFRMTEQQYINAAEIIEIIDLKEI